MRLVVALEHAHRLALAQLGEQALGKQLGVGPDDVVGGAQDGGGGAVVLLQLDDLEARKVLRQALEVVQRGAAPAVDALVVVADGGEVALAADQQLQQLVLGGVGVLVFVDQHVGQALLPLLRHRLVLAQQAQRQADQVVEVDALVGGQALLVARHQQRGLALGLAGGLRLGRGGVQAGVLPAADGPLPLARGGQVGGGAAVLDQAQAVVAVEDAELRLQAQHLAVLAQQAHAERVEGADQHLAGGLAGQRARALAHLGGGLVGEGDGGDAPALDADLQQARDLVRDDARLARSGAGQHQAGAAQMLHGVLLGEVEAG